MNPKDYGELNPAAPSATYISPADLELARTYLSRNAPDLIDMVIGGDA